MRNSISLRSAVCAAALLSAQTATAEVTASDVWADWQKSLALYGSDGLIIGEEVLDGDTLTITDLAMKMEDATSSVTSDFGSLVFSENGDGSVSVTMPEKSLISVKIDEDSFDIEVSQENSVITVTGDPGAMNYDVSIDRYTMRVLNISGPDIDVADYDIAMTVNDITGLYQHVGDALDYNLLAQSIDFIADVKGDDDTVSVQGKIEQIGAQGGMITPESLDLDAPETWFADGFTMQSEIGFQSASVEFDAVLGPDSVGNGSYKIGELAFNGSLTPGLGEFDVKFDGLEYLFDIDDIEIDEHVLASGKTDHFDFGVSFVMPLGIDVNDQDQIKEWAFSQFAFDSAANVLGSAMHMDVDIDGEDTSVGFQVDKAGYEISFGQSGLAYGVFAEGVAGNATGAEMPMPFQFGWDVFKTGLTMPILPTNDPQKIAFDFAFTNATINDEIWDMADPAGIIPRDPVTAEIDVTGLAKLFFNPFDPQQAQAMAMTDVPLELHELTLVKLLLSGAGSEISGAGAFTFDNSNLDFIDGFARPAGAVSFDIKGANSMIDKAVEMGLVPANQATMGRMFLGMFTTPTGEDQLKSTIEVNEDGHILANGQRLR